MCDIVHLTGGHVAGSLAVITDAAHLLIDLTSFLLSLFSLWLSSRPPSKRLTFGWYRAGKVLCLCDNECIVLQSQSREEKKNMEGKEQSRVQKFPPGHTFGAQAKITMWACTLSTLIHLTARLIEVAPVPWDCESMWLTLAATPSPGSLPSNSEEMFSQLL